MSESILSFQANEDPQPPVKANIFEYLFFIMMRIINVKDLRNKVISPHIKYLHRKFF